MLALILFVKQKTAYEMRISYWSSDVCSSDLTTIPQAIQKTIDKLFLLAKTQQITGIGGTTTDGTTGFQNVNFMVNPGFNAAVGSGVSAIMDAIEIGRESCRERVCQSG